MLTVAAWDDALRRRVRARLDQAWMPGDWFTLDDRVAGHYFAKASIAAAVAADSGRQSISVVEIGTRAGYSIQAFAEGVLSVGCELEVVTAVDGYVDGDSNRTLLHWVLVGSHGVGLRTPARLVRANTQHVGFVSAADLAHVDGEHTTSGVIRDLTLVSNCPVILVDDCDNAEVLAGLQHWLQDQPRRDCQFIDDGLRLLAVLSDKGVNA